MSKADFITQFAELLQGCRILPQLLAGCIGHRIDDEVRMDVRCIAVGGDLNLVTGPSLFRKLLGDLMSLHRSHPLSRREGLDILIKIDAVQLPVSSFRSKEFCDCVSGITVDAADQIPSGLLIPDLFCFHTVAHYCFHGAQ